MVDVPVGELLGLQPTVRIEHSATHVLRPSQEQFDGERRVLDVEPLDEWRRERALEQLDDDCVIPEPVYAEVVTAGLEAGRPDARRVDRAIEEGIFDVQPAPETGFQSRLRDNPNLGAADVAVIALAAEAGGVAVMDEQYGRVTGSTEGVESRGTVWILLSLVRDVTAGEARKIVDEMIDAGWYCSTDLYTRIVRKLESMG